MIHSKVFNTSSGLSLCLTVNLIVIKCKIQNDFVEPIVNQLLEWSQEYQTK